MSYYANSLTVAITDSAATTDEVEYGELYYAMVFVPSGSSITSLTFSASHERGGTYCAAYSGSTAVSLTVAAGRCYVLPATLAGARFIKMVGNTSGTVYLSCQS
jgi:hypothetical protein